MKFLNNSKTNWKYILIIFFFVFIVIVGIFKYEYLLKFRFSPITFFPIQKKEEPEISKTIFLTTDKKNYKHKEKIKISISNNLDESIWYYDSYKIEESRPTSWCQLQILQKGEWRTFITTTKQESTSLLFELEPGKEVSTEWDQKIYGRVDEGPGPKFYLSSLQNGNYRIVLNYGFDVNSSKENILFSNPFSVGILCSSDETCIEKCLPCEDNPPLHTACTSRFKCVDGFCKCDCICLY